MRRNAAIRIGHLPDSNLTVRRLAYWRRVVFAAPSYFARHGRPRRPEELADHQCIVRTAARDANTWPFRIDGRTKVVKVTGLFRTNSALAANEGAVQGLGIASAPLWQVRSLVDRGAVELIFNRFEPPPIPIQRFGLRRGFSRPRLTCSSTFLPPVSRGSDCNAGGLIGARPFEHAAVRLELLSNFGRVRAKFGRSLRRSFILDDAAEQEWAEHGRSGDKTRSIARTR